MTPGAPDQLARVNITTGRATLIGPLGFNAVYGVAFHGGVLYGVSPNGQLYAINPATGAATFLRKTDVGLEVV